MFNINLFYINIYFKKHLYIFIFNNSILLQCSKFILAPNLVKHLAEDIIPIKEWIEDHPEYLFIIFADHGHDEIGLFIINNLLPCKLNIFILLFFLILVFLCIYV